MDRRIDVQGWGLVVATRDDGETEPRIEDTELGKRLGFTTPRMIRKLIKRYQDSGDLQGIPMRATVERIEKRGAVSGIEERTVNVYELTEEQACFIAAKSETPTANALLREMIRVFVAARRNLMGMQSAQLAGLTATVKLLTERMADRDREHPYGLMGPRDAKALAGQISAIRDLLVKVGDPRKPRAIRLVVDRTLRARAGYLMDLGAKWESATASQATTAFSHASQWVSALRKQADKVPAKSTRQLLIPDPN